MSRIAQGIAGGRYPNDQPRRKGRWWQLLPGFLGFAVVIKPSLVGSAAGVFALGLTCFFLTDAFPLRVSWAARIRDFPARCLRFFGVGGPVVHGDQLPVLFFLAMSMISLFLPSRYSFMLNIPVALFATVMTVWVAGKTGPEESAEERKKLGFWRKLERSNRLFPRKLRFTKEGKILIGITLGIGFAAINTGNNLMYLVLGMLLSLMVVSGILSELTLRGVTAERVRRGPAEAERDEFFGFRVRNTKSFFVSYCVELEEVLDGGKQVSGYALRLAPGEERVLRARIRIDERGVHPSAGLSISTRFPFSMFRKSRYLPEKQELVVTPAIREVEPVSDRSMREGLEEVQKRVGRGEDIYGLKEYRQGDPPKDIHWKATAKRRKLTAREYEAPGNKTIWLEFFGRATTPEEHVEYEEALRFMAALAEEFLRSGSAVGVMTTAGLIHPGAGRRHRDDLMIHLAKLDPEADPDEVHLPQRVFGRRILIKMSEEASSVGEDGVHEILTPRFMTSAEAA